MSFILHVGHSFSSLLSCSPPTHLPPFPSTPPSSLFRKGQASLGLKQSLSYQAEVGLIFYPHIKADQCNPAWEIGFQKSAKCLGQILISLLGVLQTEQTIQLSRTCWGPRSIPCSFPNCWLRVQVNCLCGSPFSTNMQAAIWIHPQIMSVPFPASPCSYWLHTSFWGL